MKINKTDKILILSICIVLILGGCMPYKYTVSPVIRAQIIENETQKPFQGAIAYCMERPYIKGISNSEGNIYLEKVKEWIVVFPIGPWDFAPPHCTLVVKAEGYNDVVFDNVWQWNIDQGIVMIKKK